MNESYPTQNEMESCFSPLDRAAELLDGTVKGEMVYATYPGCEPDSLVVQIKRDGTFWVYHCEKGPGAGYRYVSEKLRSVTSAPTAKAAITEAALKKKRIAKEIWEETADAEGTFGLQV